MSAYATTLSWSDGLLGSHLNVELACIILADIAETVATRSQMLVQVGLS